MRIAPPYHLVLVAGLAAASACTTDRPAEEPAEFAAIPDATPESIPSQRGAEEPAGVPVAPARDPGPAAQAGLTVRPSKGQSQSQQMQDEQACSRWAQQRTGIDPAAGAVDADSAGKAAKAMATCLQGRGYAVN